MEAATAPVEAASAPRGLPDPGEPVPKLAWPTLGIFFGSLAVWGFALWGALSENVTPWLTIPLAAAVTFWMFTVLHDATHYSISRTRWVNALFGRLSVPFVAAWASYGVIGYIHIEHHRHSNEDGGTQPGADPDTWASHGPWWQLPFRWATIELWYGRFYLARRPTRPVKESAEAGALLTLSLAGIAAATATGNLWMLAVVYLIPQRIGIILLAWWFDWLPHHSLEHTQREDRYKATRARVGMEWFFTPLMLSQNYHLIHHLHPSIPFYRYIATWNKNEEAYLEREPAIATVFGQQLTPDEYRVWRELDSALARMRRVKLPEGSSASHAVFHKVPVAEVRKLTEDSVLIGFDVPEELREQFQFHPGQHLTVRTDLGGEGVRRNYSICCPATSGQLRIAVKHIPGGAFSSFAMNDLKAGDVLELMTPTGEFCPPLDPEHIKHYVGIAAGSGITPIMSILATALELEADSMFTLIYGNRGKESTMFREELDELESRYADRLQILHVRSREQHRNPLLTGRIDRDKLDTWLGEELHPDVIDEWFLCGPMELTVMAREALIEHGAAPEQVHLELFYGYSDNGAAPARADAPPATVTIKLDGQEETFELSGGETILEGALQVRSDAPYACMGGACGTCKAKLLEGDVEMDHNFALGQDELERGYVLTCQSHPTSPVVGVDYDG
jgi:phenylacetate-CoA oxygenase/reductase PaaK subunit